MGNIISDTVVQLVKQQLPQVIGNIALHTHVNYSGNHTAPVARSWAKAYGWAVALIVIFTVVCCVVTALVIWCLVAEVRYKRDKEAQSSSNNSSDESYSSTDDQQYTSSVTAETPHESYENDASSEREVEMEPGEVWVDVGRNPLRGRGENEGDDDGVTQMRSATYQEDYVDDYVPQQAYNWSANTYTRSREGNMDM